MSYIRKHEYTQATPYITTQAGTRPMTKQEQKQAQAYLLDIVDVPKQSLWVHVVSGLAIITGIMVGVAAFLVYIF